MHAIPSHLGLLALLCLLLVLPNSSAKSAETLTTHPITVTGRALDVDGKPIVDAEIFLVSPRTGEKLGIWFSDEKGEFRFDNIALPIEMADTNAGRDAGSFEIFGRAEGYAFAWRPLKWFYPDREYVRDTSPANAPEDQQTGFGTKDEIVLDLRFGSPASLSGRVVDEQGRGISNARLTIHGVSRWSDDIAQREFEAINDGSLVPAQIRERKTDAEGRFEFVGLPADCKFWISVSPPGHAPRSIHAATRKGVEKDVEGNRIYSGDMEIVFQRPRRVSLQVVYGDTNEPAELVGVGGRVSEAGFWETTNGDGIVTVNLPDGKYELGMSPRIGTDYLPTDQQVTINAKSEEAPITLKLQPAGVVKVSVVDADSKRPLAGVDVWWEQELSNPKRPYREVRGWRSWEVETRISHYESPRTDASGGARVLFEPGTHRIGVGLQSWPEGYVPVEPDGQEIVCEVGEPVDVVFEMKRK